MKFDLEPIEEIDEVLVVVPQKSKFKYKTPANNKGGLGVALHTNESVDSLIKRFKKTVIESGVIDQYHAANEFVKPSVKKRLKKALRLYRARRSSAVYK